MRWRRGSARGQYDRQWQAPAVHGEVDVAGPPASGPAEDRACELAGAGGLLVGRVDSGGTSAPLSRTPRTLSASMAAEVPALLTAEMPPKPQQESAAGRSTRSRSFTARSRRSVNSESQGISSTTCRRTSRML